MNRLRQSFCRMGALGWLASGALFASPNVLFITVDDLRPALGCYGDEQAVTPNIDRLAARGMVFRRAYSQQALCNPSRASFLTGLRPDSTGVYDLVTHFRQRVPDVVTLPQHFKQHGYHAQAIGRIFHPAFAGFGIGSDLGDEASWSEPAWLGNPRYYYSPVGVSLASAAYDAALKAEGGAAPNWVAEAKARRAKRIAAGRPGEDEDAWTQVNVRVLATEAPEVADDVLLDGEVASRAIAALRTLKAPASANRPFFLAVGFLRPHLPFIAPRRYWDLYDPAKLTVAANPEPPSDVPAPALAIPMNELRDTYPKDVRVPTPGASDAAASEPYDFPRRGPLTVEQQIQLRRGYYACISFVDAQIGRIAGELERLDLARDTIVVIVGDHGFSLGEHGLWGKLTNFEEATRSPLIICAPNRPGGQKTNALVELVDIYPTLCELAKLPRPTHLEGVSAAPLWVNTEQGWKSAAFSQYPRPGVMGYSVRTERYRFTQWQSVDDPARVAGLELYDHHTDEGENINLANRSEHAATIAELTTLLRMNQRGPVALLSRPL